jgi:hypothetical protein
LFNSRVLALTIKITLGPNPDADKEAVYLHLHPGLKSLLYNVKPTPSDYFFSFFPYMQHELLAPLENL